MDCLNNNIAVGQPDANGLYSWLSVKAGQPSEFGEIKMHGPLDMNNNPIIGGGAGTGDVVGIAPTDPNAITRYVDAGGKTIKNSKWTISDNGNLVSSAATPGMDVDGIINAKGYEIDGVALTGGGNITGGGADGHIPVFQGPTNIIDSSMQDFNQGVIVNLLPSLETQKGLGTINVSGGYYVNGVEVAAKKSEFNQAVPPAGSNDNTEGYAVGSRWIDTTNDKEYVCVDASTGVAVWPETTVQGGGINEWDAIVDGVGTAPDSYTSLALAVGSGATNICVKFNTPGTALTDGADYQIQVMEGYSISTTLTETTPAAGGHLRLYGPGGSSAVAPFAWGGSGVTCHDFLFSAATAITVANNPCLFNCRFEDTFALQASGTVKVDGCKSSNNINVEGLNNQSVSVTNNLTTGILGITTPGGSFNTLNHLDASHNRCASLSLFCDVINGKIADNYVNGTLTLGGSFSSKFQRCTVTSNSVGASLNITLVTVEECIISDNTVGGALTDNHTGDMFESQICNNVCNNGYIFNFIHPATIQQCVISGNAGATMMFNNSGAIIDTNVTNNVVKDSLSLNFLAQSMTHGRICGNHCATFNVLYALAATMSNCEISDNTVTSTSNLAYLGTMTYCTISNNKFQGHVTIGTALTAATSCQFDGNTLLSGNLDFQVGTMTKCSIGSNHLQVGSILFNVDIIDTCKISENLAPGVSLIYTTVMDNTSVTGNHFDSVSDIGVIAGDGSLTNNCSFSSNKAQWKLKGQFQRCTWTGEYNTSNMSVDSGAVKLFDKCSFVGCYVGTLQFNQANSSTLPTDCMFSGNTTSSAGGLELGNAHPANNKIVSHNGNTTNIDKAEWYNSFATTNDVDVVTVTPSDGEVLTWVAAKNLWENKPGGGGGGGVNSASNQGAAGVGLYDTKVADDLQFRNINVASNKLSVVLDAPNKEVDLDVVEANLTIENQSTALNGFVVADGSNVSDIKYDYNRTAPPIPPDGAPDFQVGSRWIDTTADKEYVCLDASAGNAVWKETTGQPGVPIQYDAIVSASGTALGPDDFATLANAVSSAKKNICVKVDTPGASLLANDYTITVMAGVNITSVITQLIPASGGTLELYGPGGSNATVPIAHENGSVKVNGFKFNAAATINQMDKITLIDCKATNTFSLISLDDIYISGCEFDSTADITTNITAHSCTFLNNRAVGNVTFTCPIAFVTKLVCNDNTFGANLTTNIKTDGSSVSNNRVIGSLSLTGTSYYDYLLCDSNDIGSDLVISVDNFNYGIISNNFIKGDVTATTASLWSFNITNNTCEGNLNLGISSYLISCYICNNTIIGITSNVIGSATASYNKVYINSNNFTSSTTILGTTLLDSFINGNKTTTITMTFTGDIERCHIDGNTLQTDLILAFTGAVNKCSIDGNTMASNLTCPFPGTIGETTFNSNRIGAVGIIGTLTSAIHALTVNANIHYSGSLTIFGTICLGATICNNIGSILDIDVATSIEDVNLSNNSETGINFGLVTGTGSSSSRCILSCNKVVGFGLFGAHTSLIFTENRASNSISPAFGTEKRFLSCTVNNNLIANNSGLTRSFIFPVGETTLPETCCFSANRCNLAFPSALAASNALNNMVSSNFGSLSNVHANAQVQYLVA